MTEDTPFGAPDPLQFAQHMALAQEIFPGPDYTAWLARLHAHLKPATYAEIGIAEGQTLALACPPTTAIGIDPSFALKYPMRAHTRVFPMTSDDFFTWLDLREVLQGAAVSFAFIDGLHTVEQALKDFMNLERHAEPGSVIAFHDVYPISAETATRERRTVFWTGDTWKVVPLLRRARPDLRIATVRTFPSGLCLVTGLDPGSQVLRDGYAKFVAEAATWDYERVATRADELLNAAPNDWDQVVALLGLRAAT